MWNMLHLRKISQISEAICILLLLCKNIKMQLK
jgi:hypothetical protein